jgi:2-polyprenyl-3-methyl-5-hydroxy-6-metoxy-1,4-benzoquinol methylase
MMIIKSEVCPVCNANEWQCVYEIAPWKILKCPKCSFSKIDPFGKVESRKEFYNQENIEKRGQKKKDPLVQFFWHLKKWAKRITRRDKNKIFYKRLQKRLKPHSHILDIGCGAGAFLAHAKERFECTGNEVSEYLAGLAKQQGAKEVVVGDFLSADFQEKTFNGITMI